MCIDAPTVEAWGAAAGVLLAIALVIVCVRVWRNRWRD